MIPCPRCQSPLPEHPVPAACPSCRFGLSATFRAAVEKGRIGGYQLSGYLGGGGMGEVFMAEQLSMKRTVALKVLHPELAQNESYVKRFFHEVRLLAKVMHPNVISAYEAGVDGPFVYFSMQHVRGRDLKWHLEQGRRFSEREVLAVIAQTASALAACWNEYRIVHRDIKPANLLLAEDNTIRIMDLGISKQYNNSGGDGGAMTLEGLMVGTPNYVSPEQARAEKTITCQSDMYSLGVSGYELLTGKLPYEADSVVEMLALQVNGPVMNPRKNGADISPECGRLMMRLMQKSPSKRYKSWEAVRAAVKSVRFYAGGRGGFFAKIRDFPLEVNDFGKYVILALLLFLLGVAITLTFVLFFLKQNLSPPESELYPPLTLQPLERR